MDRPGIEYGPHGEEILILFWRTAVYLYGDSHNKQSEDGSSKFVRNIDIQVQDFDVSNPEEY